MFDAKNKTKARLGPYPVLLALCAFVQSGSLCPQFPTAVSYILSMIQCFFSTVCEAFPHVLIPAYVSGFIQLTTIGNYLAFSKNKPTKPPNPICIVHINSLEHSQTPSETFKVKIIRAEIHPVVEQSPPLHCQTLWRERPARLVQDAGFRGLHALR